MSKCVIKLGVKTVPIYYADLNEETQKALLEAYVIAKPEDMNWDVIPLTTIVVEPEGYGKERRK